MLLRCTVNLRTKAFARLAAKRAASLSSDATVAATTVKVDAAAIRRLREATDAPVMQVRRALAECKGDEKGAMAWLHEKALALGASVLAPQDGFGAAGSGVGGKSVLKEGLVALCVHESGDARSVALAELNVKSDFAARTEHMIKLASHVALTASKHACSEGLAMQWSTSEAAAKQCGAETALVEASAVLREPVVLRHACVLREDASATSTFVGSYLQSADDALRARGVGRFAAAVQLAIDRSAVDAPPDAAATSANAVSEKERRRVARRVAELAARTVVAYDPQTCDALLKACFLGADATAARELLSLPTGDAENQPELSVSDALRAAKLRLCAFVRYERGGPSVFAELAVHGTNEPAVLHV